MKKFTLIILLAGFADVAIANDDMLTKIAQLDARLKAFEYAFYGFTGSFVIALIGLFTFARKRAASGVEKIFAGMEGKFEEIMNLVTTNRAREHLKTLPIEVLLTGEGMGIIPFLRDQGFRRIKRLNSLGEASDDALLLVDGSVSPDAGLDLNPILTREASIVYWPTGRCPVFGPTVNFANSRITLYARLMETLSFLKKE